MVHQIRVTFPASSPSFSWGWAHGCPSGYYIVSSFPICPRTGHTGPLSTPFWGNRDVMGSEAGLEQPLQLIQCNQETERGRGCAFPLVLLGHYPTPHTSHGGSQRAPLCWRPHGLWWNEQSPRAPPRPRGQVWPTDVMCLAPAVFLKNRLCCQLVDLWWFHIKPWISGFT